MTKITFGKSERTLILLLTLVQFTVVLDFAVLAPLGAQLMRELEISSSQFSFLVSAYAISAGGSGFLLAGISDRYDRKQLLLIMYAGFLFGTLLCALASGYQFLLFARMAAGIFGGVMSGISFAIVTDLFEFKVRGTVMGFIQMAFAGSQVLGIPLGLYLAQMISWNAPFYLIVALGLVNAALIWKFVPAINGHLTGSPPPSALQNIATVVRSKANLQAFLATFFLATGGFMLMPFSSPFLVYTVGIAEGDLSLVFLAAGLGSLIFTPLFGWLGDRYGKYRVFLLGSLTAAGFIYWYTHLGVSPLGTVMAVFTMLTIAVSSRMSSSSALISAVPAPKNRGAFMNINSSIQQVSGGVATLIAGAVLVQNEEKGFENFHVLGYLTILSLVICLILMGRINQSTKLTEK